MEVRLVPTWSLLVALESKCTSKEPEVAREFTLSSSLGLFLVLRKLVDRLKLIINGVNMVVRKFFQVAEDKILIKIY